MANVIQGTDLVYSQTKSCGALRRKSWITRILRYLPFKTDSRFGELNGSSKRLTSHKIYGIFLKRKG